MTTTVPGNDSAPPLRHSAAGSGVDLALVRDRRAGVRSAMIELEAALAAPLGDRVGPWCRRVGAALEDLRRAWAEHVSAGEGQEGLFAQVRTDAPQLDPSLQRLHREHVGLAADIDMLLGCLSGAATGSEPDAQRARELAGPLLSRLTRHRQRGADLIYAAYEIDVGGGD